MNRCKPRATRRAFTLIELLVVVAIIALLVAVLLPSLQRVRFRARVVMCQSTLHQLGVGITAYAHEHKTIPFGPAVEPLPPFLEANPGDLATNQIWTGPQEPMRTRMALGLLIGRRAIFPETMYCPGDDSNDPEEELAKIRLKKISPAYSSYLYRQTDETNGTGRLDNLGANGADRRATALALDMNSLITVDPSYKRTNHAAERVNVLYHDASVRTFPDPDHDFALRDADLADLPARRDTILQTADQRY